MLIGLLIDWLGGPGQVQPGAQARGPAQPVAGVPPPVSVQSPPPPSVSEGGPVEPRHTTGRGARLQQLYAQAEQQQPASLGAMPVEEGSKYSCVASAWSRMICHCWFSCCRYFRVISLYVSSCCLL